MKPSPADHRAADLHERLAVVVERQDPSHLPLNHGRVRLALHQAIDVQLLLPDLHADLLEISVDTEGETQGPVPFRVEALSKPEVRGLVERKGSLGVNSEMLCHSPNVVLGASPSEGPDLD